MVLPQQAATGRRRPPKSGFSRNVTSVPNLFAGDGLVHRFDRNDRPQTPNGLKPKDLIGVPWLLAFALQKEGWYLRADIIWNKPNCQPESVKDRPTRCHEYIFLFSKSEHYSYDPTAVRGPNGRN